MLRLVSCGHQPNYLPWLGLFHKISQVDIFVMSDDVEYSKQGFTNRNWIKTANGPLLLTVPVVSGASTSPIAAVRIDNTKKWVQAHCRAIELAYRRAPYFTRYWDQFRSVLCGSYEYLAEMNTSIICWLLGEFGFHPVIVKGSDLCPVGKKTERILQVCRLIGATEYIAGSGAHAYLDVGLLQEHGLRVRFDNFVHPEYPQLWGAFVPRMSAIDLLFNVGPDSAAVITSSGKG